jgi:hypothetical protein
MMNLHFFRCPSQLQFDDGMASTASFTVGAQGVHSIQMQDNGETVLITFTGGRLLLITPMGYGWQNPPEYAAKETAVQIDRMAERISERIADRIAEICEQETPAPAAPPLTTGADEEQSHGDGPVGEEAVIEPRRRGRPPGSKNRPKT